MTYKDLKVIDSNWLDERIQIVTESKIFHSENGHSFEMVDCINELKALQLVKSKLIDATPILEKAYNTGYTKCYYKSFSTTQKPGFEELLNTEIKLLNNE